MRQLARRYGSGRTSCGSIRRVPHRLIVTLLVASVLASACSSADGARSEPTTTTTSPLQAARAYVEPGPYPVGVVTLALATGPKVEVWYPAVAGTTGTVAYDVRDYTPPAVRNILTADIPATYEFEGARDAEVADGRFPVVLFSHGFGGIRLQSSFLTSHLASYGMVVVAPEHPSRDLLAILSNTASSDPAESVDDLLGSLDLIVAEGATTDGRFAGHVDADHVAAVGHSAGGGTALGAASDPRIDGYVAMASGTGAGRTPPAKPSFFLAGTLDAVAPAPTVTKPAYELAPSPARYWAIDGVGHNGFDDFCTFGGGTGIIGIAEQSGLGAFLDAQPKLRQLGEDGCVPPAAPVADAFPVIRHAVTAWVRWLFGIDTAPVGLDDPPVAAYAVAVAAAAK